MNKNITFSVFTKPWKNMSASQLAQFVKNLGFDGIEFTLRPEYQVEPKNAEKGLPELAKQMSEFGVKITSVAAELDENVFAGCQAAGIPIIRVMAKIDPKIGYMASEANLRKEYEKVTPLCEKYGVQVGIQHHYGKFVCNAMGLLHLIEGLDPRCISAVWDCAHAVLAGEEPEFGLDILWPRLCMVNLKNAYFRRVNEPEAEDVEWAKYATTARQGMASWPRIAEYLKNRNYQGVICLSAEYTAGDQVNRLIAEDIAYAKSLF